jgi:hypothetical protein
MSQDYRCEKLGVSWRARHAGARRPSRVRRPCRPGSTRRHRTACPEHSRHRARRYVGKRTLPPRGSPAERRGSRSSLTRWSAGASAHGQGRSTGRWSGTRRKAPAPCSDRGARPRTSLRRRQPHRLFETESRRRARRRVSASPVPHESRRKTTRRHPGTVSVQRRAYLESRARPRSRRAPMATRLAMSERSSGNSRRPLPKRTGKIMTWHSTSQSEYSIPRLLFLAPSSL